MGMASLFFYAFCDEKTSRKRGQSKEKGQGIMSEIDIILRCTDRFCEVTADNITEAECAVEEMTSLALLEIFEHVLVEDVTVRFSPSSVWQEAEIMLAIHAQGIQPLPSIDVATLDCTIEDRLLCVLIELFGTLNVERCAVV
jgi:hypothetical protein